MNPFAFLNTTDYLLLNSLQQCYQLQPLVVYFLKVKTYFGGPQSLFIKLKRSSEQPFKLFWGSTSGFHLWSVHFKYSQNPTSIKK